ncbi:MAG: zinc-dependent peptidase [Lentisphaeraceae bacterium]|nr:zinc-dependent peptidase [Lentisphaeraceae bacterium]
MGIITSVVTFIVIYSFYRTHQKKQRRLQLMQTPLSAIHQQILYKNFPISQKLPIELEQRFEGLINNFLEENKFTGCQGLEINDEIRVTVAAQACLLILNNPTQSSYKKLHTVLMYPSAYIAKGREINDAGFIVESDQIRLGESWGGGTIVLSWNHSRQGGKNFKDAQNVVLHEFAHQLDQIDGAADGIPTLSSREQYLNWAAVLHREYDKLVDKTERRKKSLMDKYGATNIAEFFAVASETFFEKPRQMKRKLPELYDELSQYYGLDPLKWHG